MFDSTEFNKAENSTIKSPYRVRAMWEFPLCVMDGYLPYRFEEAKAQTLKQTKMAEDAGLEYFTVLFHDYQLCSGWSETAKWYKWLIECFENEAEF